MTLIKLAALGTSLATSAAFLVVIATPTAQAAPDTRACVSRSEYRQVQRNMRMPKVRRIVDGQRSTDFAPNRREYRACFSETGGVDCMILLTKADGTRVRSKRVYMCQATFEA